MHFSRAFCNVDSASSLFEHEVNEQRIMPERHNVEKNKPRLVI